MKEAVVLILDANESMATTYNDTDDDDDDDDDTVKHSRFECAKQVCIDIISDLMIQSKTNEVAVLVLKTRETKHHFWVGRNCGNNNNSDHDDDDDDDDDDENTTQEIPFPNIVEIGGDGLVCNGVQRPHPDVLRRIRDLEVSTNSKALRGDFCDGIVVAADAIYKKTSGKKYQRRIILLTDAEHKVEIDPQQMLVVLDSLRAMECRLEVIGMEFHQQAEYTKAARPQSQPLLDSTLQVHDGNEHLDEETSVHHDGEKDDDDDDDQNDSATDEGGESTTSEGEEDMEDPMEIKRQNEQLLISLTEKTGGFVMAATELQSILRKLLGQRIAKSTRRKVLFQIAPGLEFEARFSLLISKMSAPTLKKQVVELEPNEVADDPDAKVMTNHSGQEITHDIQTLITHWDPEQDTREVTDIAHAYRYGSDLVPMSGIDMTGLITASVIKLNILGYMEEHQIPPCLRIGQSYALAGATSLRACAAIAALAQALRKKRQVGIATFVKSKDADPILVGLFPLEDGDRPTHLCMLQLPFRGDVINLKLDSFVPSDVKEKQNAADELVDSLMLPHDVLDHARVANPYLRSFHQTVVQRVLDPKCPVVSVRNARGDPMGLPPNILETAHPTLEQFRSTFPLKKANNNNAGASSKGKNGSRRKGVMSYHDFL